MTRGKWRYRIDYARYKIRTSIDGAWRFLRAHWFLALVVVLMAAGVLRTLAWGSYNLYRFNRNFAGLLESEWSKLLMTGWPRYQIIKRINTFLPEDAVVLVYRQSDFAFYGKRKYYAHSDDTLADYALMKTPGEVWAFLRKKGITHVLAPPYPLPSIYNTRLADVLASPVYSRLEYDIGGYKLYLLKKKPEEEPASKILVAQDFGARPEQHDSWQIFTPSLLNRLLAWQEAGKGDRFEALRIPAFVPYVTLPDSDRLAYAGRVQFQYSPLMVEEEFPFRENATYDFFAEVEGFGYFQVYLYAYQFRFNSPDNDGNATRNTDVQRILVWSGILHNDARRIRAQFAVPPFLKEVHRVARPKRAYRIVIKASNNLSTIRLRRWAIRQPAGDDVQPFLQAGEWNAKRNFLKAGWKMSAALYANPWRDMLFGRNRDGQLFAFNDNRQSMRLFSSVFMPATAWSEHRVADSSVHGGRTKSGRAMLDPAVQQVGVARFRARGHGLIRPGILFICQDSEGRIYTRKHVREMAYVLTAQERRFDVEIPAPCHFRALAMTLSLSRDKVSIAEDGRPRLPFIEMRDVKMARKFSDGKGEVVTSFFRPTQFTPAYFLEEPQTR